MGQTNLLLRHPNPSTPVALAVLLDVFTLAVVVLTESDLLLLPSSLAATCSTTRLSVLPLALHRLLTIHPGMSGTLATWLQVFNITVLRRPPPIPTQALLTEEEAIARPVLRSLKSCLSIFRYTEAWTEATVWGKIVLHDS